MENKLLKLMRFLLLYCLINPFNTHLIAQKPCIDTGVEKKWASISKFQTSNDGKYLFYNFGDQSAFKLILESTSLKWKMTIPGANIGIITQDSKKAIFQLNDSLGIITLDDSHRINYIGDISTYSVLTNGGNDNLLIYRMKHLPDDLIVRDMESGYQRVFAAVDRYWASSEGNVLILETIRTEGASKIYSLKWLDVLNDSLYDMWQGRSVGGISIDARGMQCAFSAADAADSNNTAFWLYQRGDKSPKKIIDDHSEGIMEGFRIKDIVNFNSIDKRIFFDLEKITSVKAERKFLSVDIWSYKDIKLQSAQSKTRSTTFLYKAVVNITDKKIFQLESDDEHITSTIYSDRPMKVLMGIKSSGGDLDNEWNWNKNGRLSVYLISLNDGKMKWIDSGLNPIEARSYALSYNENYLFYYNARLANYFSYCISNNHRANLTSSLHVHWTVYDRSDEPDSRYLNYKGYSFLEDEDAILVNDQHDIYELNPIKKIPVVNLTGIHGNSDDLEIELVQKREDQVINRHDMILYTVFDRTNKEQELLCGDFDSLKYIRTYNLQPYRFDVFDLTKARDSNVYFVSRMTAEESPNIYITQDFRVYKAMTDIHPEKSYKWMKTELITWKTFDGIIDQGILYKPEDFDARKKYPLVVYYYEQLSDVLHNFIAPGPSQGRLNIPMYVSHGYIVFVPDIHYKVGWPGRSAYDAVVSGVNYLARRGYIDVRRIGLQGHSFGGFETNYIIAHSHLFAAAMSASGMTDFVSAYGSIVGDGTSRQRQYELYRDRIGATLWQEPALYMENSPILRADKITTPLLMMANKLDNDVPYEQSIELFTALRRLDKKCWMLQYDGQGHNVFGSEAKKDLTIRMFQFFNYYLKGEAPPKWMTRGVPADLKGIDNGLELDTSGEQP